MKHVDMRKVPAAAQEERRRQVIGLRHAGMTCDTIAAQVGLTRMGCSTSASASPGATRLGRRTVRAKSPNPVRSFCGHKTFRYAG